MNMRPLVLASALLLSACVFATPPRNSDAWLDPIAVHHPLENRTRGSLLLLSSGDWAFRTAQDDDLSKTPPGTLVTITSGTDANTTTHLFATTLARPWGLILTRLSGTSLPAGERVELTVLTHPDPNYLARHGVCPGSGDPTTNTCLAGTKTDSRWHIFATDKKHRVHVPTWTQDRYTRPIPSPGFAHRAHDRTQYFGASQPPASWIAVRQDIQVPAPLKSARAVVDASCPKDLITPQNLHLTTQAKLPRVVHPLHVEQLAWNTRADVLLWCDDDRVTLAIPTWARPELRPLKGESLGLPLLGQMPWSLQATPAEVNALVRAGAHLARGDHHMAGHFLESALSAHKPGERDWDWLARRAMQSLAISRPELAMRLGHVSASSSWNPTRDVAISLGAAAVYAQFGNSTKRLKREQDAVATLKRRAEDPLANWFKYVAQLRKLPDQDNESLLTSTQRDASVYQGPDRELWTLATWARRLLHTDLTLSESRESALKQQFAKHELATLYHTLRSTMPHEPCPKTGTCAVDAYGQLLSARVAGASSQDDANIAAEIAALQGISLQPSLHDPRHLDTLLQKGLLESALTLLPSLPNPNASQQHLLKQLGQHVDLCQRQPNLKRISQHQLNFRSKDNTRALRWLFDDALTSLCQGDVERALAASKHDTLRWRALFALLDGYLHTAPAEQLLPMMHIVAKSARSRGERNVSARWNMLLATALERRENLQLASVMATRALASAPADSPWRQWAELVSITIHGNHTGLWRTPKTQEAQTLLQAFLQDSRDPRTSKTCPALARTSLQGVDLLPPNLRKIVERVPLSTGNKTLSTHKEMRNNATALLTSTRTAANFGAMKKPLQEAQRSFATARDTSGATAVAFVLEVLEKTPAPKSLLERAQNGEHVAVHKELSAAPPQDRETQKLLLALSFLMEPWDKAIDRFVALGSPHIPSLCEVSELTRKQ